MVQGHKAALSSATQHVMPSEFGREWGTECFSTRFPLPTLMCAGYSVKLIFLFYIRVKKGNNFETNKLLLVTGMYSPALYQSVALQYMHYNFDVALDKVTYHKSRFMGL